MSRLRLEGLLEEDNQVTKLGNEMLDELDNTEEPNKPENIFEYLTRVVYRRECHDVCMLGILFKRDFIIDNKEYGYTQGQFALTAQGKKWMSENITKYIYEEGVWHYRAELIEKHMPLGALNDFLTSSDLTIRRAAQVRAKALGVGVTEGGG